MIKGVGNMTIAEHLEINQPLIYNFLIDLFKLDIKKTDRKEPEFEEDLYLNYRYYKAMMEKPRGVKQ